MAHISIPITIKQSIEALIESMYRKYEPTMIYLRAISKSPYGGTGTFYSGTQAHTFVWSHNGRPYIGRGPDD